MSSPSPSSSNAPRATLTPRAAVLLAAVVMVVALVVVVVAVFRSPGGPGGAVTVTGAAAPPTSSRGPGPSATGPTPPDEPSRAARSGGASVVVHVAGAVRNPGVVTLSSGARVETAIERAGGAEPDADLARLNLARPLEDGERIYVPSAGETAPPQVLDGSGGGGAGAGGGGPGAAAGAGAGGGGAGAGAGAGGGGAGAGAGVSGGQVDLNAADQAALETLPGIGPALAGRIIAWREEHGGFRSVEDLLEVSGIGDGRFAELRELVRV